VNGRRFLIGAGSNCQLQLGGPDIPILHSILLVEPEGAHIDSVVAAPQLLVNGHPQRSADLQDGDVFSIGKFEFRVHVPQGAVAQRTAVRCDAVAAEPPVRLENLTAAELAAQIEHEERLVHEFEAGRLNGARALLAAARARAAAPESETARADHADAAAAAIDRYPAAPVARSGDRPQRVCFSHSAVRSGATTEGAAAVVPQRRAS
jgi:predicted component of type VI protein secretion system